MTTHSFEEANLQNLIEKIAKDEGVKQPKFDITSATKPGENLISRVYRVRIMDESNADRSLSVILKASSSSRARQVLTSSDKLFRTETEMYGNVLPALNELLAKHGIGEPGGLFPGTVRCIGWELNDGSKGDTAEIVVVEDKSVDGFKHVPFAEGFNVDHCRLVLDKLALLHSSFMALRVLEPEKADRFEKLIYKSLWTNDPNHVAVNDITLAVKAGFSMLEEPYVPGNPVYEKLRKIVDDFANEHVKANETPEDVAVIAHGDCWSNNILCRSNQDGKAAEICFIDFQLSRVCSPAVDLMYVLMMCTSKESRDKHYNSLVKLYFDSVHKYLRTLGCNPEDILPWGRLQKHLKMYGRLGVGLSFIGVPLFMSQWSADIHSANESTGMFSDLANTSESKDRISKRLNDIVTDSAKLGYF